MADATSPATQRKVLVAEDEKTLASALQMKLEQEGFAVTVVHTGQQALDALQESEFDVMLLDIIMPEVDGWDVLQKINAIEEKPKVKIVVTSNLSQAEDAEKAKKLGAVDFLIKSNVSLSEIVEKIASA